MWTLGGHADDRLHTHQGAPLGRRRKRGEKKQAVGRSRGGRNTKIHALADAKGRLIAILLTAGEAHDCPVAERLIRRVKPPKRMLGDKAYDSAELREELQKLTIADDNKTGKKFKIEVDEITNPDLDAQLVAESIAQQMERRVAHRRAMKQAIQKAIRFLAGVEADH